MVRFENQQETSLFCGLKNVMEESGKIAAVLLIVLAGTHGAASAQRSNDLGIPADSLEAESEMEIPQFSGDDVLRPISPQSRDLPSPDDLENPEYQDQRENSAAPLLPPKDGIAESYDEDLFYDAGDLVPQGELARRTPRKVNPKLEPASKLIIVKKSSGPNSVQARLVSASRALTLGRYDAALEIYRSLYSKNPKNPSVLMGVAVALQRIGEKDAAIAAYDELLEVEPGNVDAEVNMLGLLTEKYPQVALHRLTELRQKNPASLGVVAQLAVTQARLGKIESAIKYLGVAASMEPENPSHLFNMGVIADQAGKKKQAIEFYENALEVDSIYGGGRLLNRDVIFERLAQLR